MQVLLASLTNRLPDWSRTQELAGRVALAENNAREAKLALNSAITKPNPNPELVRMVIDENVRVGDFLANTKILENRKQIPPFARILTNGRWARLQQTLDINYVDRGLRNRTKPSSVMWDAYVGNNESTESDSTADLSDLMLALWRSSDKASQEEYLTQLEHQEISDGDLKSFVLGQGNHLAGKFDTAKQFYRKVVDSSERRLQAEIYAGTATNQLLRERSRQFELAQSNTNSTKRLEAIMKLRRARQNDLEAARALLQSLVAADAEETDRILLAKCLEELGKPAAAQEQLEAVVESEATAHHVAILIDFLLRAGENEKAQVWIEQLEEQTGWEKKTVTLRARWLAATNRTEKIPMFVEKFAAERFKRSPKNMAQEMQDISDIYLSVNLTEDAKRWLTTLATRFPNQAEPLSRLLVENDETDRAIQRCIDQLQEQTHKRDRNLVGTNPSLWRSEYIDASAGFSNAR